MADPRVQPATSKTPAARRKPDSKPDSKHPLQPEPQSFATAPDERAVASLADLTRLASAYLTEDDIRRIRDAYRVSDEAHLGNFRSSGEPYISHPIAVAETCAHWKLDTESLMAALLHDVLEDTATTKEYLHERFGAQVAELVDGLSKLDRIEFASREHAQAESFRKMLLAMARDVRVILIKLSDRLHNMRTLNALERSKQVRVARETLEIYAPIASRLGLHKLYRELLDLCFRFLYPFRYRVLRKAVQAAHGNRREVLGKILGAVQKALPQVGVHAEVVGREKALYGIYRKMKEKRQTFSQVLDIYGFRVIVKDLSQCYLALGILHGTYKPLPGRFKDYIALPKTNGYQSLHTTLAGPYGVPVEFQIRTREMQRVAESGVAAHWLYKADKESFTDLQKRTHQWLQSLLDIQNQTGDSLEFIDHVKVDLFPDTVYVFTPRGEIRALPRGSTIIDFAYSVHTDVGDRTVSAIVNRKPAPLRTQLQNGDMVEVVTDPAALPNPSWLGFVRTGKARAEIRHSLRHMSYGESVELGKRLLEQSLAALRIDAAALDPHALERGARDAGVKSVEELYAEIGLGKRLAPVDARTIALQFNSKSAATLMAPRPAPLLIHGNEGSAIQYSSCCRPLPGDRIIGHLRGGHGLALHREDCKIAARQRTRDAERWIEVLWAEDVAGSFQCEIEMLLGDQRGALARVAADFAASDANIVHISMDEQASGSSVLHFIVQLKSRVHLAQILRLLRRKPEVSKISRV